MYFKEERTSSDGSGGESNLYSIDLTGYNERKIITPLGGMEEVSTVNNITLNHVRLIK